MKSIQIFFVILSILAFQQNIYSQYILKANEYPHPYYKTEVSLINNQKVIGILMRADSQNIVIAKEYLSNSNLKVFEKLDTILFTDILAIKITDRNPFSNGFRAGGLVGLFGQIVLASITVITVEPLLLFYTATIGFMIPVLSGTIGGLINLKASKRYFKRNDSLNPSFYNQRINYFSYFQQVDRANANKRNRRNAQ
jgi:hypothetical protein